VSALRKAKRSFFLDEHFKDVEPWDLTPCSPEDVIHEINKLKGTNSAGPDGISNNLLKFLKFDIATPLAMVINKSISSGRFPSMWKSGKICPVPKKGPSSSIKNYRPVCLASNIGKVVEAVVRSRVMPSSHMYGIQGPRTAFRGTFPYSYSQNPY